jgi:hypothetical protein
MCKKEMEQWSCPHDGVPCKLVTELVIEVKRLTEKYEPKNKSDFKVGDWVVTKLKQRLGRIIEVHEYYCNVDFGAEKSGIQYSTLRLLDELTREQAQDNGGNNE